jgi:ubiquitin carboxyl-terminal hydrolase 4/11
MFDLGYFTGPAGSTPTGWSEVDEDRTYPTIASRNPRLQRNEDDESVNEFDRSSTLTGSETSNDDDELPTNTITSVTRMNDESSEEDEDSPPRPVSEVDFLSSLYPSQSSLAVFVLRLVIWRQRLF